MGGETSLAPGWRERLEPYRADSLYASPEGSPITSQSLQSRLSGAFKSMKEAGAVGRFVYESLSAAYWRAKLFASRNMSDEEYVAREFRRHLGRPLDLSNPRTFAEKLQHLKLYDQTPLHAQCADKIRVRDYAQEHIPKSALIPLVLTTYDVEDINERNIPDRAFVVKTNHDSGSVQFCRDRDAFDWAACRRRISRFMKQDFSAIGREIQYRRIRRGIIVEKMIEGDGGDLPDYKLYCFAGEPLFVQVDVNRFTKHRRDFFDLDWTPLNVQYNIPNSGLVVPRPETLPVMLDYARRLARPFKFCRIDLFSVRGHVYFGEVTFHPYSGFREFTPQGFDRLLGDMIPL